MKFLEELALRLEGSDPEDGDKGVKLDLDDKPRALFVFLNGRGGSRRVCIRHYPGFPA